MKYYLNTIILLCAAITCHAQWYNDGIKGNSGGHISDGSHQGINTATGQYSTAGSTGAPDNYGVFEHLGQSGSGTSAAFINYGTYDASVNGRDYFLGPGAAAGQQEISGNATPVFGALFLQNGANQPFNITNTNGIRVATSLSFENGITTTVRTNTTAGAIKLDDNATYSNTALGDAQHVDGYFSKAGDDAFTFPVGSGTDLRTLTITAPVNTSDEYSVAWLEGDPSSTSDPSDGGAFHPTDALATPILSVSTAGQWDWIPLSGSGAGLGVTVSIPDLSGTGVNPADLRLVGWNGTAWTDLSGGPNATGVTEGSQLSGTMQSGITAIAIGATSTALPVELLYFFAVAKDCNVRLEWQTAMEANSAYFSIERSTEGAQWKQVGQVKASGNSRMPVCYTFDDPAPPEGTLLYRLKKMDMDGTASLSNIARARISCANTRIVIYPNPSKNFINIDELPQGSTIQLINSAGKIVLEQKADAPSAIVSLSGLAQGLYSVVIVKEKVVISNMKISYIP